MSTESQIPINRASYAPLPGTAHASPDRENFAAVQEEARILEESGPTLEIFSKLSMPVVIVNESRQAVYANRGLLEMSGTATVAEVLGLRLGEILNCRYAVGHIGGCGTSTPCRTCGVTNAVLAALGGRAQSAKCHVRAEDASFEEESRFTVHTIPFILKGLAYTVLIIEETS